MSATTKKPTAAETAALDAKAEEYRRDVPPGIEYTDTMPPPPIHLFAAILKAQKAIETVRKNGENPHFKSKYATLDEIWETVRKPINDAGLVVYCDILKIDGERLMITHLAHAETGEEISCSFPIITQNVGPQAIGSAMTYARRYTLTALLEIVTGDGTDDDGEAATNHGTGARPSAGAAAAALGF